MPFITKENAKELGKLGGQAMKAKALAKAQTKANAKPEPIPVNGNGFDPLAYEIACAQSETLKELRAADCARDRAQCARALRELRETWHLVTGEPKPGTRKESTRRQPREQVGPGWSVPVVARVSNYCAKSVLLLRSLAGLALLLSGFGCWHGTR